MLNLSLIKNNMLLTMLKIKLLDEISKSGKQILDRIFHLISQPIRNSLWKMTPNLVLAPLLMTLILFSYALFHEVSYGGFLHFQESIFGTFPQFFHLPDILDDGLYL